MVEETSKENASEAISSHLAPLPPSLVKDQLEPSYVLGVEEQKSRDPLCGP